MNLLKDFKKQIKEIICIHNYTKHYILLGEELDENFETYLQPIKEFRDAYEHIIRIFTWIIEKDEESGIQQRQYISNNLNSVLSHEYRAFFDTADWFTIICRKKIYDIVGEYSFEEVCKKYPEYPDLKAKLLCISEKIADIREKKDISHNIYEEVNRYQYVMVGLLELYRKLVQCKL